MSKLTTLTRMWLTRSFEPFRFINEADAQLPYQDAKQLGLYVHIPFCKSICSFCPYCKQLYDAELCDQYIDALIQEIHLVTANTSAKKEVSSLYFGGGTPALAIARIHEIIEAIEEHFIIKEGIGLELHPDNVNVDTLRKLKAAKVSKISIGIQSFQDKFLSLLGRTKTSFQPMFDALAQVPFETVSMDFIFALPQQTFDDLRQDIEMAFSHGANHIAIYPFIDFSFTKSDIPAMKKKEKRNLLDQITTYCAEKGYHRDSIWTFAKEPTARYSSMTRANFLGFGCSATTLLQDQFKINTFSVSAYCSCIQQKKLPTSLTCRFTKRQRMIYYLFWTAYSTRLEEKDFLEFFHEELSTYYGKELWLAQKLGFLTKQGTCYEMTLKGAFYYHYYEHFYTLSYIDQMWSVMRKEAFPDRIEF